MTLVNMFGNKIPAAGGGATVILNDTFTDPDSTLLSAHTPEIGGAWSFITGTQEIQSGEVVHLAGGSFGFAIGVNALSTNDFYGEIVLQAGNNVINSGIILRATDNLNFIQIKHVFAGGTDTALRLITYVSGTPTDQLTQSVPYTDYGAPLTVKFQAFGDVYKFCYDGEAVNTWTDTGSLFSAANCGLQTTSTAVAQMDSITVTESDGTQL